MPLANLPEPSFIDRDPSQITTDMVSQYEAMSGKTLYPAQPERLLIDMQAYRETETRIGVNEAAKLNLVRYSRYPVVDYPGEFYGCVRLAAKPARCTLRFTLPAAMTVDFAVSSGQRIASKNGQVIFDTLVNAVIPAGSLYVDIQAQAETPGASGNGFLPGEVNSQTAPLSGIASVASQDTSNGGMDAEDDERYRQRILLAPEGFAAAGPSGAYRYWALSADQAILDVSVVSPYPGLVVIYALTADGTVSPELNTLILTTLSQTKRRPLTDQVVVCAPVQSSYSIAANITLYSWASQTDTLASINAKLTALTQAQAKLLGRDIVPSQIVAAIMGITGVQDVVLQSPGAQILNESQYSACSSITVNFVGFSDG